MDGFEPIANRFSDARKGIQQRGSLSPLAAQLLIGLTDPKNQKGTPDKRFYRAASNIFRAHLHDRWNRSKAAQAAGGRMHGYFSIEFLEGPRDVIAKHSAHITNTDLQNAITELIRDARAGLDEDLYESLPLLKKNISRVLNSGEDPRTGNGGLGRLAVCMVQGMAELGINGIGYGIKYAVGLGEQDITDGRQNLIPRPWQDPYAVTDKTPYEVKLFGYEDPASFRLKGYHPIKFWAEESPSVGYTDEGIVNTIRLWHLAPDWERDSGLGKGDYWTSLAMQIDKPLYPDDHRYGNADLRLMQEYAWSSLSLQHMIRRHLDLYPGVEPQIALQSLPKSIVIQLNDTHPALAIPEATRILCDEYGMEWNDSKEIARRIFAYTNHTLLPEALERVPLERIRTIAPRLAGIIEQLNSDQKREVYEKLWNQQDRDDCLKSASIIKGEDKNQFVDMVYLCMFNSQMTNGVSELHTQLLRQTYCYWLIRLRGEDAVMNCTNGISSRWAYEANPEQTALNENRLGHQITRFDGLSDELASVTGDPGYRAQFRGIKEANKTALARFVQSECGIQINDVQSTMISSLAKRIHEYKRQLLHLAYIVSQYQAIKEGTYNGPKRLELFSGKAADGYDTAKTIIRMINKVADVVNEDADADGKLQAAFVPDYKVSTAEEIIPGTDVSVQISEAGTEAAGTGNMKFTQNGALTISTRDGAMLEIGAGKADHVEFFGHTKEELDRLDAEGYQDPKNRQHYLDANGGRLRKALEFLRDMEVDGERPFTDTINEILVRTDRYKIVADFEDYCRGQDEIVRKWRDPELRTTLEIEAMRRGYEFSIQRTIQEGYKPAWDRMGNPPSAPSSVGQNRAPMLVAA